MSAELASELTGPPSSPSSHFASSPPAHLSSTIIIAPVATDHACCCKQCGRGRTHIRFQSDNTSPITSMTKQARARKAGEKMEALLEMFRTSYLQVLAAHLRESSFKSNHSTFSGIKPRSVPKQPYCWRKLFHSSVR